MKKDFSMEKQITNEKTGISYTLIGDYYIPDLRLPGTAHEIGRFGRAHLKYLKEYKRMLYTELLTSGRLNEYLRNVDLQAQEMFDRLVKEYAERQGVTERLKADDQMEWVGRMNNIRAAAEEFVLSEIIYR